MSNIYTSAEQLIGNTPLLELRQMEQAYGLQAKILAKLEYLNPAGSAKDRVARAMLDDAEARGLLNPNSVIIEPTSGNTGIGRYAQTWTGDNDTSWDSLRYNIATMLGCSLSGISLTGSDIGGFAGPAPDAEFAAGIFRRACICAVTQCP